MKLGPHGRAHRILARLAQGSAIYECLQEAAWPEGPAHRRAKTKHVLRAMAEADLIAVSDEQRWSILRLGREALAELEAGREFNPAGVANVRIFRRAA